MTIIYVLIPLSLLLLSIAVWAFFWAVRNEQFDDLDTPALDVLDDDEITVPVNSTDKTGKSNSSDGNDSA